MECEKTGYPGNKAKCFLSYRKMVTQGSLSDSQGIVGKLDSFIQTRIASQKQVLRIKDVECFGIFRYITHPS